MARLPKGVFEQVMANRLVQQRIREVASRKAAAARRITEDEGGSAEITVHSGVRPKGRAYTNIQSSSGAEEYGTAETTRRRALGRAVREG
ncbi:hypothetical protein [Rhodococcus sp. UNC363MFTsu5.1]|uniref:hypothetical protein n=1 Tax=Rhodococcus sp. UNC363MFTsu5.1 TaxID=1449069 RepID=UPI00047FA7E4|nr:hypothetical protein [Rhodococcus sp. UNC363MFTsu5.1]